MPLKAIDYSKNVIYKIQHKELNDLLYVGHTTDFTSRKMKHKSLTKSSNFKVYQMIRENGGWESFNMVVVEDFPCEKRTQASKREDEVMRELKANMNMLGAIFDKEKKIEYQKEHYKANKEKTKEHKREYKKQYRVDNKEKKIEQRKQYREANKEKIAEQLKQYHQANKEKLAEYKKQYREANKEKLKEHQKQYREAKRFIAEHGL